MAIALLQTKLYIPPPRLNLVLRPRLLDRLNQGVTSGHKLTLISAPAGFGKTTLISEWIATSGQPVAWLSLDERDSDIARFMSYLVAAIQTIKEDVGVSVMAALQSRETLTIEPVLTVLINEIATIPYPFVVVLDDYHAVESTTVDQALEFLVERQPPQMHLVIATREDPSLPLPRLRACGQLTELRAADLRFTPNEVADFLNQVMGLNLSADDINALEARTEGWIAGLQLAALSMQGHADTAGFIQSFTGSHRFILDYLVEEVLRRQPEDIQTFLLRTSILDRLCASLCEAVMNSSSIKGQDTLEYLEHANLFIVPLDNNRQWYRYHHLFAELLHKRLEQNSSAEELAQLHLSASKWYESNRLMVEAFNHAVCAKDVERAEFLMEHKDMPTYLPGVAAIVLKWLESLPESVLNAKPSLLWKQALMMLNCYKLVGVEEKLQAAEAALAARSTPQAEMDDWTRNLMGKIAVGRTILALMRFKVEPSLIQGQRALELLHHDNLSYRASATNAVGFAHYLQGDWEAAEKEYQEALALAQAAGDHDGVLLGHTRLGQAHELRNQLHEAEESYRRALELVGDNLIPFASVVYLGLARIYFEWNDLDTAEEYGEMALKLGLLNDQVVDRLILSQLFMSRLKLIREDLVSAEDFLAQAEQIERQNDHTIRLPDIAFMRALIHLYQGNLAAVVQTAKQYDLPTLQARALIAQGNPTTALELLELHRRELEEQRRQDLLLSLIVLQAFAYHLSGKKVLAFQALAEALPMAEPNGFIRVFTEKGEPMRLLIRDYRLWLEKQVNDPNQAYESYLDKLLAAFAPMDAGLGSKTKSKQAELVEPLSERELEVLQLICQGLSNQEICQRLYLALDTVKGHNRRIFEKLLVHSRTEAIARARELNLF